MRDSALRLYCGKPSIANGAKRVNRIILEVFDNLALGLGQCENLENAIAGGDKVIAERAEFSIAERLVQLADLSIAASTFV
jgi:hypothetical protein